MHNGVKNIYTYKGCMDNGVAQVVRIPEIEITLKIEA